MVWFKGEEFTGRQAKRNKRKGRGLSILRVDAKQSKRRKTRLYRTGVLFFAFVVLLAAVGASWVGLHTARERLFSTNSRFVIRKIEIETAKILDQLQNEKLEVQ